MSADGTAFWLNPDWKTSEDAKKPFWFFESLAGQLPESMALQPAQRFWFTNRISTPHQKSMTLPRAMEYINDTYYEDKPNVSFNFANGLDEVFLDAIDVAARLAFGRRFKFIRNWEDKKVFVWEGQYHKTNEIQLQVDASIIYGGFMDMLADAGAWRVVFDRFVREIRDHVEARYPRNVRATACHRGHCKDEDGRWAGFVPSLIVTGESVDLFSPLSS